MLLLLLLLLPLRPLLPLQRLRSKERLMHGRFHLDPRNCCSLVDGPQLGMWRGMQGPGNRAAKRADARKGW